MNSINTECYKSPFYYEDQSKFYVLNKKIEINSDSYISNISNQITSLSTHLKKRMLILCTSYKQVKSIANNLLNNNKIDNDIIFMQASKFSKNSILKNYKKTKNSILIGTSTFWEGIDLSRDLLEILVIVRIPFGNPSNPYNKHLSEKIQSIGGNSFYDLELPNAILKMKQGIGRLIRSDMDSGVCIITDPRIYNSSYGKFIINELPVIPETYYDIDEIIEKIHNFLG
jgi:ATP-dependent DNA helicase DinG